MSKFLLSLLAICFVGSLASAETLEPSENSVEAPISIEYDQKGTLNLKVLGTEEGKLQLRIFKKSGQMLFEDNIKHEGSFKLPIDLSQQKEGEYKIVVKGKDIQHEQTVFHSELVQEDVYATIQSVDKNKINVKVLHNDTPVDISLTTLDGRTLYQKTYLNRSNFQQQFDLSAFEGQPVIATISGQKSYIRFNL